MSKFQSTILSKSGAQVENFKCLSSKNLDWSGMHGSTNIVDPDAKGPLIELHLRKD